eukprot:11168393-Lingulodinium_polyedra.AAC.1
MRPAASLAPARQPATQPRGGLTAKRWTPHACTCNIVPAVVILWLTPQLPLVRLPSFPLVAGPQALGASSAE